MATGTSASILFAGSAAPEPNASVRLAQARAGSNTPPFRIARAHLDSANQSQAPIISPGGVVPNDSSINTIQSGEWVSIYGINLAAETASWNGDFPTTLAGTSVTINGKSAYLLYVSPDQINLQAPNDTAVGSVPVVVTTAAGSGKSTVTLAPAAPSFSLMGGHYVVGIILRSDGSGAYGGGSYDILGPTGGSLGFPTVAASPGDLVSLYGVGFGPTNPAVPAGELFSGAAPVKDEFHLYINHLEVKTLFVGLSSAGLYQINLKVPCGLGSGDVPIRALVGGGDTQLGVLFSLQSGTETCASSNANSGGGGYVNPPIGSGFVGGSSGGTNVVPPSGTVGGTNGGTVGSPPSGTGNSGTNNPPAATGGTNGTTSIKKPYQPRLSFPH
jgi:uncharacterized protein (TIGR03437 family)